MPVAASAGKSLVETEVRNLVEQPKSPCRMPEYLGSAGSLQNEKRAVGWLVVGLMIGCFFTTPIHCP